MDKGKRNMTGWINVKIKPLIKEDGWDSQFDKWLNLFLKAIDIDCF